MTWIIRKEIEQLLLQLTGSNSKLVIPRFYIDLTGDHVSALILSQLLYWSERTTNPDGWFWKTAQQWYEELRVTSYQISRVIKGTKATPGLQTFGVETKLSKVQGAPVCHYRINRYLLMEAISKFLQNQLSLKSVSSKSRNLQMDSEKTQKSDFGETKKSSIYTKTTLSKTTLSKTTLPPNPPEGENKSVGQENLTFPQSDPPGTGNQPPSLATLSNQPDSQLQPLTPHEERYSATSLFGHKTMELERVGKRAS